MASRTASVIAELGTASIAVKAVTARHWRTRGACAA